MIRIGTDCSGIEAPIEALKQLKIPFVHQWSCEIDPFSRLSIEANYHPKQIFSDIRKRDHKTLPNIDVYVCGFPCQPFSLIGDKQGLEDKRGNIMYHCIKVIKYKKPKLFILENVKNFKYIQGGLPFNHLINKINKLGIYEVYTPILNTRDYGIPQNRERLYIIGIRKNCQVKAFNIPASHKQLPDLDRFLIDKRVHHQKPNQNADRVIKTNHLEHSKEPIVIAAAGYGNYMVNMCPSITCNTRYYLLQYKRYLFPEECLKLQGFPSTFKKVVSKTQLYKQAGNAMSVNVLKTLFNELFACLRCT